MPTDTINRGTRILSMPLEIKGSIGEADLKQLTESAGLLRRVQSQKTAGGPNAYPTQAAPEQMAETEFIRKQRPWWEAPRPVVPPYQGDNTAAKCLSEAEAHRCARRLGVDGCWLLL